MIRSLIYTYWSDSVTVDVFMDDISGKFFAKVNGIPVKTPQPEKPKIISSSPLFNAAWIIITLIDTDEVREHFKKTPFELLTEKDNP